jgi:hypothetical protein
MALRATKGDEDAARRSSRINWFGRRLQGNGFGRKSPKRLSTSGAFADGISAPDLA